jgi:hypothetical protein
VSFLDVSLEDRRLLNPAFCGALLAASAAGHVKDGEGAGLPYVYAYLVLPLILHPETRARLPTTVATKLVTWAERNGEFVAQLPRRLIELATATREGLLLAGLAGAVTLGDRAELLPGLSTKALTGYEKQPTTTPEVAECLKRALFLGRWLAGSGTQATVLAALGVRL